jgi:hypothetical protein
MKSFFCETSEVNAIMGRKDDTVSNEYTYAECT